MDPNRPQKRVMSDMVVTRKPAPKTEAVPLRKIEKEEQAEIKRMAPRTMERVTERPIEKPKMFIAKPEVEEDYEVMEDEDEEEDEETNEDEEELDNESDEDSEDGENERVPYEWQSETKKRSGCFLWVIAFVCIVALAIGIGGLFVHANVKITPKKFSGDVSTTITMSQVRTADNVTFGSATKTFTDEQVVPATSFSTETANAKGAVKFYNTGTASETIKKGALIISTKGMEYSTDSKVTIPAQKGTTPGQVEVKITAVKAGAEGNVGLDDFLFVTSSKGLEKVTIRGVTPIAGGSSGQDAVADPEAIAKSSDVLRAKLSDTTALMKRMSEEIPEDMLVLPIIFPASAPTITTEANHADGVHVVAKQVITILLVKKSDVARALGKSLKTPVPTDVPVSLDSFDGLTVTTSATISNQVIPQTIPVRISGPVTVVGAVDGEALRSQIGGLTRKAVREKVEADPAVGASDIHMRPFWRRILPIDLDKITVTVLQP